jgi:hypothetical protein
MGQKVNPNILRMGIVKQWGVKYLETKTTDTAFFNFKNLEIKNFTHKFFKDNGLIVHNYKCQYFDEGSLHLFISYYLARIKKYPNKIKKSTKHQKNLAYQKVNFTDLLKKYPDKIKELIECRRRRFKYRQFNSKKFSNKVRLIKANSFLTKFFKSLATFVSKKMNIFITFNRLDKDLKSSSDKKGIKSLKNDLVKLRRYKQNKFFEEGTRTLFISTRYYNSANILAQFIATQLQKNKRHKFFLNFIKTTLTRFKASSPLALKGMKIKIKGRFNGAPRARSNIILIGNGVPNLTINANIDYSETTSYTSNGTFGVKVWIYTSTTDNAKRAETS